MNWKGQYIHLFKLLSSLTVGNKQLNNNGAHAQLSAATADRNAIMMTVNL